MDEVLAFINKAIRDEKGTRVTIESSLRDADLDSFGITMLFMAVDDEYSYFTKGKYGKNPFDEIKYDTITIKEIVSTCIL